MAPFKASLWLSLALLADGLRGGVVSGIVLEQISGIPLARSRVRLDRIDSTGRVQSSSSIAGRAGQFVFSGVPSGLYVLTAMRDGYAPMAYGQRRPQGTAPPFEVGKESNLFAELRLRKLAAITGRVLDENRIGIRRVSVSAYLDRPPFRAVTTAESDDRGVYRLHGLAPGKYRVRSVAFQHDDGLAVLPTFGPESLELRDSGVHSARLDEETAGADVTPIPGALISVGGPITCAPPGPVLVTIASDTGRRQTRGVCNGLYRFDNLAPGPYEIFAEIPDGRSSAFVERGFYQSTPAAGLDLRTTSMVEIALRDETGRNPVRLAATVVLRRVDLAGVVETRELPVTGETRLIMAPGWWEIAARLPLPYFVEAVNHNWYRGSVPRPSAHPDWFEVSIPRGPESQVSLWTASKGGGIAGRVADRQQAVPGIPVFLWPVAAATRRRSGGPRAASTNAQGEFRFEGLAPGEYKLLASFDYDEVDAEILAAASGPGVTVEAGGVARLELAPYAAPY